MLETAYPKAAPTGKRYEIENSLKPGLITHTTPKNPTKIAPHLQKPTLSPRTGIDKAVTKNGPTKAKVIATANSILANAE
tara:strand:- start:899 stop:1138 length:240 start_codon:yes stop_codon:yes gene_type:complete